MQASHCGDFSCCRAQPLGAQALAVVVHRLSCPAACGLLLDQRWNLCLLNWQVDSLPLSQRGSPMLNISGESGHLCLIAAFRGKAFIFFTFKCDVSWVCHKWPLLC